VSPVLMISASACFASWSVRELMIVNLCNKFGNANIVNAVEASDEILALEK
jgi:hypothetical protein